ncbi:MAG: ABC transporter ATP-binding protein [Bacilli bacterium]|nr:ABC transporter ATP-binding protein [Bacilli bacterium]
MSYIEVKNLSFGYDKNRNILEDISINFDKGKIVALIGKNGSGKSTFLDCILGINDYYGVISIEEHDIKDLSDIQFARLISFIPQSVQINIDYTIFDFISFGRNPHIKLGLSMNENDYQKVICNAEKCGISKLLEKSINKVSGGELQLAFIARALTQETPIFVMDEPTASLDFGNQQKLFKIMTDLVKEGKTIIFTTHNPNHLINLECDIFAVSDKKINPITELNSKTIKEIYGEEFEQEGRAFLFKL